MDGVKLHLGCGKRYLPGYAHVDLSDYPHVGHRHRVDDLYMVEDGAAAIIYASHVLEYFSDEEAPRVLKHWCTKLRPGGILRLAVPDFDALVDVYQSTRKLELISGPIYGIWKVSPEVTVQHKCIYNYGKLANRLFDAGFESVQTWDWRKVFIDGLAGFDDYSQAYIPHLDKENGKLISLNVEAIR